MKADNTMEPYSQGTNQIITLIYVVWSKDDSCITKKFTTPPSTKIVYWTNTQFKHCSHVNQIIATTV